MTEIVFLVADAPEGGFVARSLGHSIHTEAVSYAELRNNLRDAVQCHFEAGDRPTFIRLEDELLAA